MKSAYQLAITESEHQALIAVMNGLRSGQFVHGCARSGEKPGFNMDHFSCGTSGCIGGWVAVLLNGGDMTGSVMRIMEKKVYGYIEQRSPALTPLYYPDCETHYTNITPDEAAEAIDNFLTTGDPNWRVVLNEPYNTRPEEPDYYDDEEGHDDF